MTDPGEQDQFNTAPGLQDPGAAPAGSPLGRLAARRAELQQARPPLDLDVPGYGGVLVARYKMPVYADTAKAAKRLERVPDGPGKDLLAVIDGLIMCCTEILERHDDDSLTTVSPGYTKKLAEILEFEADTAREVIQGTFPDEWAILEQAKDHAAWVTRQSPGVDETLVGEA